MNNVEIFSSLVRGRKLNTLIHCDLSRLWQEEKGWKGVSLYDYILRTGLYHISKLKKNLQKCHFTKKGNVQKKKNNKTSSYEARLGFFFWYEHAFW